jgi:hypothetical protein
MAGVAVSLFAFCFYLIHRLPNPTDTQLPVASAFAAATSQAGGAAKTFTFIHIKS